MPPPHLLTYPLPFAYDWERPSWGSGRILVQPRQKISPVVWNGWWPSFPVPQGR